MHSRHEVHVYVKQQTSSRSNNLDRIEKNDHAKGNWDVAKSLNGHSYIFFFQLVHCIQMTVGTVWVFSDCEKGLLTWGCVISLSDGDECSIGYIVQWQTHSESSFSLWHGVRLRIKEYLWYCIKKRENYSFQHFVCAWAHNNYRYVWRAS